MERGNSLSGVKRGEEEEIVFGERRVDSTPGTDSLIQIHERASRLPSIRGKRNQNGAVDPIDDHSGSEQL